MTALATIVDAVDIFPGNALRLEMTVTVDVAIGVARGIILLGTAPKTCVATTAKVWATSPTTALVSLPEGFLYSHTIYTMAAPI